MIIEQFFLNFQEDDDDGDDINEDLGDEDDVEVIFGSFLLVGVPLIFKAVTVETL